MNVHYITFATSNWVQSKPRLSAQLLKIQQRTNKFFKTVRFLNELDINDEFYALFGKYIIQDKTGFLYYTWKPYLLMQELSKLQDGEYMIYMDGGSSFTANIDQDIRAIKGIIDKLEKSDKVFFAMSALYTYNFKCITKKKFIEKYKPDDTLLYKFLHYQSGFIVFKKNKESLDFCTKWYEMMRDNYEEIVRLRVPRGEIFNDSADQCYMQYLMYTLKVPCFVFDYCKKFSTRIKK